MIYKLLLTLNVIAMLFVISEATTNNRTTCAVDHEDNIVKQEIQKFYCTAVELYDELETVSIQ